jgi:hypothetical protein
MTMKLLMRTIYLRGKKAERRTVKAFNCQCGKIIEFHAATGVIQCESCEMQWKVKGGVVVEFIEHFSNTER